MELKNELFVAVPLVPMLAPSRAAHDAPDFSIAAYTHVLAIAIQDHVTIAQKYPMSPAFVVVTSQIALAALVKAVSHQGKSLSAAV